VLTLDCPGAPPAKAPTVTRLSDTSGAASGGVRVNITGTGFTSQATVSFGTAKAKTVTVLSPTTIVATAPAGKGTVNVTVKTASGTSKVSAKDLFTYIAAPVLTRISPAKGPAKGGTTVVIAGKGFASGDAVMFGTAPARSATIVSATKIIAVTPRGRGTVHVTVTNAGGTSTRVVTFGYPPLPQAIKFAAPAPGTVGKVITLKATGGASGNPVVFSVAATSGHGVCAVSGPHGSRLTYKAAGKCVIDANQAGTTLYSAAPQVSRTIAVRKPAARTASQRK
jgi:IPT/TIG domain-containing protein